MKVSEIEFCGCMGPMYGEPLCYCQMKRLGLPLNEAASEAEDKRARTQLEALFAKGRLFGPEVSQKEEA